MQSVRHMRLKVFSQRERKVRNKVKMGKIKDSESGRDSSVLCTSLRMFSWIIGFRIQVYKSFIYLTKYPLISVTDKG